MHLCSSDLCHNPSHSQRRKSLYHYPTLNTLMRDWHIALQNLPEPANVQAKSQYCSCVSVEVPWRLIPQRWLLIEVSSIWCITGTAQEFRARRGFILHLRPRGETGLYISITCRAANEAPRLLTSLSRSQPFVMAAAPASHTSQCHYPIRRRRAEVRV